MTIDELPALRGTSRAINSLLCKLATQAKQAGELKRGVKMGASTSGTESCTRQKGIVRWLFSCSFRYLHLMSPFVILGSRQDLKCVSLLAKLAQERKNRLLNTQVFPQVYHRSSPLTERTIALSIVLPIGLTRQFKE